MTTPITWVRDRLGWRGNGYLYTVGPSYTYEGEKWRGCLHASINTVRVLGEIRDTAEEAKADCQREADRIAALQVAS